MAPVQLRIVEGDLLESGAEAVMLPIDGTLPVHASTALIERSLGRIARSFHAQVDFPLPLGSAAPVELGTDGSFRVAIVLSMLAHHADRTSDDQLRAAAAGALAAGLGLCDALGLASVAAPLLKGGWRVSSQVAMTLMLRTIASAQPRHPLAVEVRLLGDAAAVTTMQALARTFGLG
jgi:hypothetical protein